MKELQELPGVGAVTAQRIVDMRQKSGRFHRVEDLLAIRGISQKKLEAMRPYVIVSAPPSPSVPKSDPPPKKGPSKFVSGPTPVEQASACLVLNFANAAKFKCKQAEACSTGRDRNDNEPGLKGLMRSFFRLGQHGNLLGNVQAIAFQRDHFSRMVGENPQIF